MSEKQKLIATMASRIYAGMLVNLDEGVCDFKRMKRWAIGEAEELLEIVEEDND